MTSYKEIIEKWIDYKGRGIIEHEIEWLEETLSSFRLSTLEELEKALLSQFDKLEAVDTDTSMEQWKNYKFIRNNIRDVISNFKKSWDKIK